MTTGQLTTGQLTTGQLQLGNQQLGNSDNWAIPTGPLRRLGTYKFICTLALCFFNQRMCILTIAENLVSRIYRSMGSWYET